MNENNSSYKPESDFQFKRIGVIAPLFQVTSPWDCLAAVMDEIISTTGYAPGDIWKLGDVPNPKIYPPKSPEKTEFFKTHPTSYLAMVESPHYDYDETEDDRWQDFVVGCYTIQTNSKACREAQDLKKGGSSVNLPEREFAPKFYVYGRVKRVGGKFDPSTFEINTNKSPDEGPTFKALPRKKKDLQAFIEPSMVMTLYSSYKPGGELKQQNTADPFFILDALLKNATKFRVSKLNEDLNSAANDAQDEEGGD